MKKGLLLFFGIMTLFSLMAESGPKRNSILSKLGLDNEPACCGVTNCCAERESDCCDVNCCETTTSSCCSSTTSQQKEKVVTESRSK